jgi:hypothetical protein
MRIKIGQLKRLIKEAASTIKVIREDYGDCETCDGTGIDPDLSAEELESIQTQQQADWDWARKRFFEKDK